VVCGGSCVELKSDNLNCGACGTACVAGWVCSNGDCAVTCATGQLDCGGGCIDPMSDPVFCGAAADCSGATVCGPGATCYLGQCEPVNFCAGVTCPAPSDRCHVAGACVPATGACTAETALTCPDGQRCDLADGACRAERCVGVTCLAPPDRCHLAGICAAENGLCSAPVPLPCPAGQLCDLADGACKGRAPDTWRARAPMPTARVGPAAAVANGKVYVIGGWGASGTCLATVEEYDPVLDTWTPRASMPTARCGLAAVELDGRVWAIGGTQFNGGYSADRAVVETYDPVADQWTVTAPGMLTPRCYIAAATASGKIYAIGGTNTDQTPGGSTTVEAFDPATNQWSEAPPLHISRSMLAAASVSGTVFALGGFGRLEDPASTVESYDPFSSYNKWWPETDMSAPRRLLGATTVGSRIYAVGGATAGASALASVEEYDVATRLWTFRAPLPTPRSQLVVVTVNGLVYAIGGTDGASAVAGNVEEYTPP
jgi:hypothetical protein